MSSHDDNGDNDFEDRPRRRRRRDDDYDSRPAAKSSSSTLIILLVVGGIAALGCCGTIGVALLLPAIQKVRDAGTRARDTNNLKQIGIGAHNYNDVQRNFPPAMGGLSWRVHILPFIEQDNLYRDFDLEQPWDGPDNRRLADIPVKTFARSDAPAETTDTPYRVFTGPGTLYEPGEKPLSRAEIKDGASSTIFAIEAAETVPWPQPKELPFTPNGPIPALGSDRNVVLILLADGSVKAVRKDQLDPALMRGLITPNGGEVLRDW